jgi:serine/threonine protein kinase
MSEKLRREAQGRLIGKGKFGCVFHPPLTHFGCRIRKSAPIKSSSTVNYAGNHEYVMKIMKAKDAQKEMEIGKLIHQYDAKSERFITLIPDVELILKPEQYKEMWNWDIVSNHDRKSIQTQQVQNYYHSEDEKEEMKKSTDSTLSLSNALSEMKLKHKKSKKKEESKTSSEPVYYGYISRYGGISYESRLHRLRKENWWNILPDLIQLMESLQFMHDQMNIVHRDLKSPNYAWKDNQIRVLDLGLARSIKLHSTLEKMYDAIDNVHFQIWSIEMNTKYSGLRTVEAFRNWMNSDKVRRWCIWYDYCQVIETQQSQQQSTKKTSNLLSPKTTATETKQMTDEMRKDCWYDEYIGHCIKFWEHVECFINDKTNKTSKTSMEKVYLNIIIMMLKQNDVLSIGLMICDFVLNQYITYQQRKKTQIPQVELFQRWICNVLVLMIHPNFRYRLKPVEVISRTRSILMECQSSAAAVNKVNSAIKSKLATDDEHSVSTTTNSYSTNSLSTASLVRRKIEEPIRSPVYKRTRIESDDFVQDDHASLAFVPTTQRIPIPLS